jgi:hypothetical protein
LLWLNGLSACAQQDRQNKKAISVNGIFRPVIVSDGQVIGIWKRANNKEIILVECQLFQAANKALKKNIESAAEKFGQFLNKKVQMVYKPDGCGSFA